MLAAGALFHAPGPTPRQPPGPCAAGYIGSLSFLRSITSVYDKLLAHNPKLVYGARRRSVHVAGLLRSDVSACSAWRAMPPAGAGSLRRVAAAAAHPLAAPARSVRPCDGGRGQAVRSAGASGCLQRRGAGAPLSQLPQLISFLCLFLACPGDAPPRDASPADDQCAAAWLRRRSAQVVPKALLLTPNQFEAELLTGKTIKSEKDAVRAPAGPRPPTSCPL